MPVNSYYDITNTEEWKAISDDVKPFAADAYWDDFASENPDHADYAATQKARSRHILDLELQEKTAGEGEKALLKSQILDSWFQRDMDEGIQRGKITQEEKDNLTSRYEAKYGPIKKEQAIEVGKIQKRQTEAPIYDELTTVLMKSPTRAKELVGHETGWMERAGAAMDELSEDTDVLNDSTDLPGAAKILKESGGDLDNTIEALKQSMSKYENARREERDATTFVFGADEARKKWDEVTEGKVAGHREDLNRLEAVRNIFEQQQLPPEKRKEIITNAAKLASLRSDNDRDFDVLSNGEIIINPNKIWGNYEGMKQGIRSANVTDTMKSFAIQRLDEARQDRADIMDLNLREFAGDDYKEYTEQNKGKSKVDLVDGFSQQEKGRNWASKAASSIGTSFADFTSRGIQTGATMSGLGLALASKALGGEGTGAGRYAKEVAESMLGEGQYEADKTRRRKEVRGIEGEYKTLTDIGGVGLDVGEMFLGAGFGKKIGNLVVKRLAKGPVGKSVFFAAQKAPDRVIGAIGKIAEGSPGKLGAKLGQEIAVHGIPASHAISNTLNTTVALKEAKLGRQLTDQEIYETADSQEFKIAAGLNAAQTVLLQRVFGKGVESFAKGGKGLSNLTLKDLVKKGGGAMFKDIGWKKSTASMLKGLGVNMSDESIEEGLNQGFEGAINKLALGDETPFTKILEDSLYASALGALAGGVPGQLRRSGEAAQYQEAEYQKQEAEYQKEVDARLEEAEFGKSLIFSFKDNDVKYIVPQTKSLASGRDVNDAVQQQFQRGIAVANETFEASAKTPEDKAAFDKQIAAAQSELDTQLKAAGPITIGGPPVAPLADGMVARITSAPDGEHITPTTTITTDFQKPLPTVPPDAAAVPPIPIDTSTGQLPGGRSTALPTKTFAEKYAPLKAKVDALESERDNAIVQSAALEQASVESKAAATELRINAENLRADQDAASNELSKMQPGPARKEAAKNALVLERAARNAEDRALIAELKAQTDNALAKNATEDVDSMQFDLKESLSKSAEPGRLAKIETKPETLKQESKKAKREVILTKLDLTAAENNLKKAESVLKIYDGAVVKAEKQSREADKIAADSAQKATKSAESSVFFESEARKTRETAKTSTGEERMELNRTAHKYEQAAAKMKSSIHSLQKQAQAAQKTALRLRGKRDEVRKAREAKLDNLVQAGNSINGAKRKLAELEARITQIPKDIERAITALLELKNQTPAQMKKAVDAFKKTKTIVDPGGLVLKRVPKTADEIKADEQKKADLIKKKPTDPSGKPPGKPPTQRRQGLVDKPAAKAPVNSEDKKNTQVVSFPKSRHKQVKAPVLGGKLLDIEGAGISPIKGKRVISEGKVVHAALDIGGNSVVARLGNLTSEDSAGEYKPGTPVVRVESANDLPAILHETGHFLEEELFGGRVNWNLVKDLGQSEKRELEKLGKSLYPGGVPTAGYMSEGFAEYVRILVEDGDAAARKSAPTFNKWINQQLAKDLDLSRRINHAIDAIDAWKGMTDEQREISRVEYVPTRIQALKNGIWDFLSNFNSRFINSLSELESFGNALTKLEKAAGMTPSVGKNPGKLSDALRGTAAQKTMFFIRYGPTDFFGNRLGKSLMEALAPVRGYMKEFTLYVWAKRTKALQGKLNSKGEQINSGLEIDVAENLIKKYESPEFAKSANFKKAAADLYQFQKNVLQYYATVSPEAAAVIELLNQSDPGFYLPLQRAFSKVEKALRKTIKGSGIKSAYEIAQKLEGSARGIKNPFGTIIANTHKIIKMADNRKVFDLVVESVNRFPRELSKYVTLVKSENIEGYDEMVESVGDKGAIETLSAVDANGESIFDKMISFSKPDKKVSEVPTITIVKNKKHLTYEIDPKFYEALTAFAGSGSMANSGFFAFILRTANKLLKTGAVGLSAEFQLRNPFRDYPTMMMNIETNQNDYIKTREFAKSLLVEYGLSAAGVKGSYKKLFEALGLGGSIKYSAEPAHVDTASKKLFRNKFMSAPGVAMDYAMNLLQTGEVAARIAAMKIKAEEIGFDPTMPLTLDIMTKLALAAKKSTVDFSEMGSWVETANRYFPFLAASLQGLRQNLKSFKRKPLAFIGRGLTYGTLPALVAWWRLKDDEDYKELSTKAKFSNTHVRINGQLVAIPVPFELGHLFMSLPVAIVDSYYREDPEATTKTMKELFSSIIPNQNPAVKMILEQYQNEVAYTGAPIVPKYKFTGKLMHEQYGPQTSNIAITAADLLYKVGLDASPMRIDHAIKTLTGGAGVLASSVFGRGGDKAVPYEEDWKDKPGLKAFFPLLGYSKSVNTLYEMQKALSGRSKSEKYPLTKEENQTLKMANQALKDIKNIKGRQKQPTTRAIKEENAREVGRVARGWLDKINGKNN